MAFRSGSVLRLINLSVREVISAIKLISLISLISLSVKLMPFSFELLSLSLLTCRRIAMQPNARCELVWCPPSK